MASSNKNRNVMYVNLYTNTSYSEDEILDLNVRRGKDDSTNEDVIFNILCRSITRCEEQRIVLKYLTYHKEEYTIAKLITVLNKQYEKSERTYRRAIEYLISRRVLYLCNNVLYVKAEYDLSLLDLDKIKGIMIHII